MQRSIVVTGIGILSAIGKNVDEFTESLRLGRSGVGRMKRANGSSTAVSIAAEIPDFSLESALSQQGDVADELAATIKKMVRRSPVSIQASVIAALQAWRQSELDVRSLPPERIGVVVAGSNLSQQYQHEVYQKFQDSSMYVTPSFALHFLDTDQVGTLSEIFQIQGEGFTVGGASASGNAGILKAQQLIQLGLVDACLVVGALADLSLMELQAFANIGAMGGKRFADQPEQACRPFDKMHEGFIYGQASGCMVLESLVSAQQRKVRVLAELAGAALTLDGNRLSNPSVAGEARAMQAALDQAGIDAQDIDYLNAHGSSSPLGDETELRAIEQVFGECALQIMINATKGFTGHCLYSAGIVEAIATIVQLREGFLHPNANLLEPIDPRFRFCGKRATQADLRIAMSNSFGFGGINTSIILKKWQGVT